MRTKPSMQQHRNYSCFSRSLLCTQLLPILQASPHLLAVSSLNRRINSEALARQQLPRTPTSANSSGCHHPMHLPQQAPTHTTGSLVPNIAKHWRAHKWDRAGEGNPCSVLLTWPFSTALSSTNSEVTRTSPEVPELPKEHKPT